MKRPDALLPHVPIAAGILVSALIEAHASGGWMYAAPVALALAIAVSNAPSARRHSRTGPISAAPLLAASCLLAGVIVQWQSPEMLSTLLPGMGIGAWAALSLGERSRAAPCSPQ